jgi:Fur family ferric uptake transcriptional regulator
MPAELHETVAARLRSVGQRYTSGRRALVDQLSATGQPVTIPEIVTGGPGRVPQSSAYRNLAVLEQAGVVHRIVTSGDFARYELTEDLTEHHHHLICSSCGTVEDFTAPPRLERTLHEVMADVGGSGFTAESHRLDLIGTCATCG